MSTSDPITCPVDKWYYKRMGLLMLMLSAFVCWFLYDWKYGYPKKAKVYQEYAPYQEGATAYGPVDTAQSNYDDAVAEATAAGKESSPEVVQYEGELKQAKDGWMELAKEKGFPLTEDGERALWSEHAAENSYDTKPKKIVQADIDEQLHWAAGFGVIALGVGVVTLLNRNKKLEADGESWTDPRGTVVRYDSIKEVDKRKWDNKGLAYVHFEDESGNSKKVTLDDLKYTGAVQILDRILAKSDCDIIETIQEDDDEQEELVDEA